MKKLLSLLFIILISSSIKFLNAQDLSPEEIFDKVNDAVVIVLAMKNNNVIGQGSGVVINEKGYIVTNYHVYKNVKYLADKLVIKHYDEIIEYVEVIGLDEVRDVLILQVYNGALPSLIIGNSDVLKTGEKVYAIGSPLGLENSISDGIISGFRNEGDYLRWIQTTASISKGSSGGALVNAEGELIGITTMQNVQGQNLNFAVPINEVFGIFLQAYDRQTNDYDSDYFDKGYVAFKIGKYNDALLYFSKYLDVYPDVAMVYRHRGLVYIELKKYQEAIKDFTKTIEIDPDYEQAYINRARVYQTLKSYEKAIEDYYKATNLIRNNDGSLYDIAYVDRNLGIIYIELKEFLSAKIYLDFAIQKDPNNASAYANRGIVYMNMFSPEEAIQDWEKAIEIDPDLETQLRPYINDAKRRINYY